MVHTDSNGTPSKLTTLDLLPSDVASTALGSAVKLKSVFKFFFIFFIRLIFMSICYSNYDFFLKYGHIQFSFISLDYNIMYNHRVGRLYK